MSTQLGERKIKRDHHLLLLGGTFHFLHLLFSAHTFGSSRVTSVYSARVH